MHEMLAQIAACSHLGTFLKLPPLHPLHYAQVAVGNYPQVLPPIDSVYTPPLADALPGRTKGELPTELIFYFWETALLRLPLPFGTFNPEEVTQKRL